MQTFLPVPNFVESAKILDYRRLGKQRVEADQIYKILTGQSTGNAWKNHPAVLMWKGYEDALLHYRNEMIGEWVFRGYNNTMKYIIPSKKPVYPDWLGNKAFHASHRANLLRKDYTFYSSYRWREDVNMPYYWPTKPYKFKEYIYKNNKLEFLGC